MKKSVDMKLDELNTIKEKNGHLSLGHYLLKGSFSIHKNFKKSFNRLLQRFKTFETFNFFFGATRYGGVDAFKTGREFGQDERLLIDPLPLCVDDSFLLLQVHVVLLLQLGLRHPLALADARDLSRRISEGKAFG